jgi:glycosyltransferase involved in cell wall biosynthesis
LAKNGIKYNELIMLDEYKDHGNYKRNVYKQANNKLFIESSLKQAETISGANKQVLVPYIKPTKLNILAHMEPTRKPAGASITICTVAGALSRLGHNVKISQDKADLPYMPPNLRPLMVDASINQLYRKSDVVLVHWRASKKAIKITETLRKPRVHFFCDGGTWQRMEIKDAALVVYNSKWLQASDGWKGDSMVIYPPVYPELFATDKGDGILLVTPHQTKGIDMFLALAERMPDRRFVIAMGRGQPILKKPANIDIIENVADPREIYSQARLVLMPSRAGKMLLGGTKMADWVEGYGRVAIEAAASGIPTIASSESVGLRECWGSEGLFAGQDKIDEWVKQIEALDDADYYKEKSEYALRLSAERHPDKQIAELEERLYDYCNR